MTKKINAFVGRTFRKIDADGDGRIQAKEVKAHLKRVGVGGGFLGLVHSKATGAFLSQFDADGDKQVSWSEFQDKAAQLVPKGALDAKGRLDRGQASLYFQKADANGDRQLTLSELRKAIKKALPPGTSFKGTVADVAARLGLDALDSDGDKKLSRQEFFGALKAIEGLARKANVENS